MATEDPMMASVAGRYAAALFETAKDAGKIDAVEGDLVAFQKLSHESPDLARLVRSPVFAAADQSRALSAVIARMGATDLTANFFKLLARNRRLFAAPDMIKAFRTLAARAKGRVDADVTSAHALTPDQLAAVRETLKASLGKDVQVHTKVDAGLLGGLVVKIGNRMIDSSLRTKLSNLRIAMKGAN